MQGRSGSWAMSPLLEIVDIYMLEAHARGAGLTANGKLFIGGM